MAMDEWRVEVHLDDEERGFSLGERLRALHLDDEVAARLGDRVIVTRDGPRLYVYAQGPEAAREAEGVVRQVVDAERLTAGVSRRRWNPIDRRWQDADEPVPEGDEDARRDAAHEAEDDDVRHPLFVYVEGHEPRFLRDLGL